MLYRTILQPTSILNAFEKLRNKKVIIRKASYKGRGRPKKSDYVRLKMKDIPDYKATELLEKGFNTSYTYDQTSSNHI